MAHDDARDVRSIPPSERGSIGIGDAALEEALRACLGVPEEPPAAVQASLVDAVRARGCEREVCKPVAERGSSDSSASPVPWWVISTAGVLQVATAALGVGLMRPGGLVSYIVGAAGLLMAVCAVALPAVARGGVGHRPKEVRA